MTDRASKLTAELATIISRNSDQEGPTETAVPGLISLYYTVPFIKTPTVYRPSFCILAQGAKEIALENQTYTYGPGQCLVVPVDLPVVGQVVIASKEVPYLCLAIEIDRQLISELIVQSGINFESSRHSAASVMVGQTSEEMLECVVRLARLLDSPNDIPILAPMATRELFYRLLHTEYGVRLAQIAVRGGIMERVAEAISLLRRDYARTIRVEEMAALVGMSPSSFHQHFKHVTTMSPLQYQKRIRLLAARAIMLAEDADAASTSYRVGYESPSQFSREYSRMFGTSPIADRDRLRLTQGIPG
ncbi:MAG: AraC family transcriptional regulator [Armatimonadetes bacterium]|nr:AraC family transcriptional regulator [Armatimonadota bacterium]